MTAVELLNVMRGAFESLDEAETTIRRALDTAKDRILESYQAIEDGLEEKKRQKRDSVKLTAGDGR